MIAWGYSLGTGVAIALAAEHPFGGLILGAPHIDRGRCRRGIPLPAGPPAVEGLVCLRYAHPARHGAAPDHARDGGCDRSQPPSERLFGLEHESKRFLRLVGGHHDDRDNFDATDTARQFIAGLKG
jgi:pimeloyl-ACP methyl ester carboxylesterase